MSEKRVNIVSGGIEITVEEGPFESAADKCRTNGWAVGTRLVGDEGYGPTVIEITAIGEESILAKTISHNGDPSKPFGNSETLWSLEYRDWKVVA